MGVKITDMTTTTVDGTEIVPTSKSAAPRSVTVEGIKGYVVDQIEAITPVDTVGTGQDVLLIKSGALTPVDIDVVLQRALTTMWGKDAIVTPIGADKLPILDDTVEKTVSVTVLAEAIRGLIEAAILDVSDLADGAGTVATTDYMLVTQGTTAKRIQISNLSTLIYASLAAHVAAKTTLGDNGADTDVLYVVRSGTAYKVALSALATYFAGAGTVGGSGTTGYLAKWTDTDEVGTGPAIVEGSFAAGTNDQIPTALAVRTEMNTVINDSTDIGAALVDADTILVDDGALGTTQRKSALSRVWTYVLSKLAAVPAPVPTYTVATLPSVATYARAMIYVSDETSGAVIAFSDGTNWRRVTDRAVVS